MAKASNLSISIKFYRNHNLFIIKSSKTRLICIQIITQANPAFSNRLLNVIAYCKRFLYKSHYSIWDISIPYGWYPAQWGNSYCSSIYSQLLSPTSPYRRIRIYQANILKAKSQAVRLSTWVDRQFCILQGHLCFLEYHTFITRIKRISRASGPTPQWQWITRFYIKQE